MLGRWIDNLAHRIEQSPKARTIWRERDGVRYTALLWDKACYAWRYHRVAIENIVTFISAAAGSIIAQVVLR